MGKSVHVPSERKLSKKFPMPDPIEQEKVIAEDVETLHRMGYGQELLRRMSGFSNYAISLSIICILAGGITSFHLGLCSVGGAAIGLGWPLASLLALAFAATMAQVASAFPTAGGLYHWASILGGRGWGWATAEGTVTLTGPGTDPHGPEVEALVTYYRLAAGEHPDWDEYRSVMVSDRRVLMTMTVEHVYGARIR